MTAAHVSSFVVLCRPRDRDSVRAALAALPGVEVHHCGEDGKIVALAAGDESHVGDALVRMQSVPGVIAANMVYHGAEEEE